MTRHHAHVGKTAFLNVGGPRICAVSVESTPAVRMCASPPLPKPQPPLWVKGSGQAISGLGRGKRHWRCGSPPPHQRVVCKDGGGGINSFDMSRAGDFGGSKQEAGERSYLSSEAD